MQNEPVSFIGNASLSFRAGETFHIMDIIPDQGPYYAVMLLETPPLPGIQHEESHNLTVLASARYPTTEGKSGDEPRWGWVSMDAEAKDMVGKALVKLGAQTGKWYYMLITGGIGHRSIEHIQKILNV